jgi:hypothetical protein
LRITSASNIIEITKLIQIEETPGRTRSFFRSPPRTRIQVGCAQEATEQAVASGRGDWQEALRSTAPSAPTVIAASMSAMQQRTPPPAGPAIHSNN